MYTFLWQKYGLKPLVVEWASSIIHGIKTRSQDGGNSQREFSMADSAKGFLETY